MKIKPKLGYNMQEAAAATGVSRDTLTRAINAGDLALADPRISGEPIRSRVITGTELQRWLENRTRR